MGVVGDVSQSELYKMLTSHIFIRFFVFRITLLCKFTQIKRTKIGSKFIRLVFFKLISRALLYFLACPNFLLNMKKAFTINVKALSPTLVGAAGFEPTTSSTPRKRSTKLSHAPNHKEYYTGLFGFCQHYFLKYFKLFLHRLYPGPEYGNRRVHYWPQTHQPWPWQCAHSLLPAKHRPSP